jgi:hypothetical protein
VAPRLCSDWRDGGLRNARTTIELDRTIAAFDGDSLIAGAVIYTRSMTIPGAGQPIAGVTLVAAFPRTGAGDPDVDDAQAPHRPARVRREPIAALNDADATIYGRFGYGVTSRVARLQGEKRSMRFRSDIDVGHGTIRLFSRGDARPLVYRSTGSRPSGTTPAT